MVNEIRRSAGMFGIVLLVFGTLLCVEALIRSEGSDSDSWRMRITMWSDTSSTAQLFYDTGSGFNEEESQSLPVSAGVINDLAFSVRGSAIRTIRLDPLRTSGMVRIASWIVESHDASVKKLIPLEQVRAANQISGLKMESGELELRMAAAVDDPQVVFIPDHAIEALGLRFPWLALGGVAVECAACNYAITIRSR